MGMFWGWVRNKIVNEAKEEATPSSGFSFSLSSNSMKAAVAEMDPDSLRATKEIAFTLKFAKGGSIVSIRQYDPKSDRHSSKLVVIPEDKDAAMSVGEIGAMEIMLA